MSAPGYVSIADPMDPVGNPHFYGSNADGTIYEDGMSLSGACPNPDRRRAERQYARKSRIRRFGYRVSGRIELREIDCRRQSTNRQLAI